MVNKIDLSKSLPRERWSEFFDQFSDGNRGRHISIESISSASLSASCLERAGMPIPQMENLIFASL